MPGFLKQMKATSGDCCILYEGEPFLVFLKWMDFPSWRVTIFRDSDRRDFEVMANGLDEVKRFAEDALLREFPGFFRPPTALERVAL